MRELLDGAAGGHSAVLYIEGAAGLGKTRLLAEAATLAKGSGFDVVAVRVDESNRYPPLAPLLSALPEAESLEGREAEAHGRTRGAVRRHQLLDRLAEVLERRAERAPVAVLVDDVHWADPATLLTLRVLPNRLAGSPIVWLMAGEPVPDSAVMRLVEQSEPGVLRLAPLPAEAAAELAADLLGAPPDSNFSEFLAAAGGNPFLITELLREAIGEGSWTVTDGRARLSRSGLAADFSARIAQRLEAMPEDMADLLRVASVLGREFDLLHVARLLGHSVGQLVRPMRRLLREELLVESGPWLAFRHDLFRQAVRADLPTPLARALHREAADTLLALGRRPAEVVRHLLTGALPGDIKAAATLRAAAREIADFLPDTAADLALSALELTPPEDPERVEALTDTVRLLGATRRLGETLALATEALSLPMTPAAEASLRLTTAEMRMAGGRYPEALEQLDTALTLPDLPPALRLTLLKAKGTTHANLGEVEIAEAIGLDLVDAAYHDPDPAVVASAMLFQSHIAFLRGRLARAAELAGAAVRRAEETPAGIRLRPLRPPELWLATVLTSTERLEEADRLLREGRTQAEASGDVWSLPAWHTRGACLLLERGELGDAEAEAESALAVGEELDIGTPDDAALAVLALVAIRRGDLSAAARHLASADQDRQAGHPPPGSWTACAQVLLLDAQGDPGAGVAAGGHLYEAGATADLLALPPGLWPLLAAVALRANARPQAEALAATLGRLPERDLFDRAVFASATHVRGLLHADEAALEQAADGHRQALRPLAAAAAEEDLARLTGAADRPHDAARWLRQAMSLALSCGAVGDAERLQRRLEKVDRRSGPPDRVVAPKRGWESLTESELRVVRLVTEGLSNRAVADRLFLSPHTVNSHLRHVFAKLGVSTRVEVTRIAATHVLPPDSSLADEGGRPAPST
ncbi:LuxR C-terminal-related transcriptional regulator [Actinoallomurus purpureus]|nr:LuxR C-terminal-related transcriptional regulator [Actinoallomurus purpureus]